MKWRLLLCWLPVLVIACGSEAPPPPAEPVDTTPLPPLGRGLIDTTALSCTTLVPPSSEYAHIRIVVPGSGQRLLWADPSSQEFRVMDSTGTIHKVGGKGTRTGEFQQLGLLGWLENEVWAADLSTHTVQYFDDQGRYRKSVALGNAALFWIPRPGGRYVGLGARPSGDTIWAIVAMQEGKERVDTVATFASPIVADLSIVNADSQRSRLPNPLANRTYVGHSDAGDRWCAAMPQQGEILRLKCVSDYGKVIFDTTMRIIPRTVPAVVYDSLVNTFVTRYGVDLGVLLPALPPTSSLAMVSGIRIDGRQDVWISRSDPVEPVALWIRVRRDGAVQDTLKLPGRLWPLGLRNDSIWAADISKAEQQPVVSRCTVGGNAVSGNAVGGGR